VVTLRRLLLLLLTAGAVGPEGAAAQFVPPEATWYTFDTEHFRVSFMDGLEPVARRAAARAEWAHELLTRELLPPPPGRIELLIADNFDIANGLASPFPRNRIIAYVHPPAGDGPLAFHDDWLEMLLLHEIVHIFHLDHATGVWRPLRRIFGRDPLLFPEIFTPDWLMEGLATYFESAHTGGGRVQGTTYDMILRTAILEDAFFRIDQVTLDPVTWPGATAAYSYGAFFIDHLAAVHGPDAVSRFIREIGGRIVPYRLDALARRVFGETLSSRWALWEEGLRQVNTALRDSLAREGLTTPELLTWEGRGAFHPRFAPDGSAILYGAATGRAEPELRRIGQDGRVEGMVPRSSLGPAAWLPGGAGVLYTQLDFVGPHHLVSDLYHLTESGRVRRLTRGARVWDADPHPDGGAAVAVAASPGTNRLVLVDLGTGAMRGLTAPSLDEYWAGPRWGPAGDRFAVSRWRSGFHDLVVLDREGQLLLQVTDDRAIDSSPAWSPDGRYLLFSSDRTGIANLYAYDTRDLQLWQVTNVLTGAFQPDVSPDGRSITFAYYGAEGYRIARIAFEPDEWRPAPESRILPDPGGPTHPTTGPSTGGPIRRYSAFPSVAPAGWSLVLPLDEGLGFGIGAAVGGADVVGRHTWAAELMGYFGDARGAGGLTYRYRGLGNPALELRAHQQWEVQQARGADGPGEVGPLPALLRRERLLEGGVSWIGRGWRSNRWAQAGLDLRELDLLWEDADRTGLPPVRSVPLDLGGTFGVGYSSARGYGLSIGAQDGVLVSARLQARRYLDPPEGTPRSREHWRATGRTHVFQGFDLFGFAPSVFAMRLAGGAEGGAAFPGFRVGGNGGRDPGLPFEIALFRGSAAYPVRGYPPGAQSGSRLANASVEYRFPIRLVERGFRLAPLALNRLWGDVFADAGAAWCPQPCPGSFGSTPHSPDPLLSVGAEAILDLRVGYRAALPVRFGFGVPLRGPHADRPRAYVRVGEGF
jgi:hypothetical protein